MGYYIQTERENGQDFGKAQFIVDNYNGRIVSQKEAEQLVESEGVIVVCENPMFEAAGFADNLREFQAFTSPTDYRPKTFVVIDRGKAEELSGYKERH